MSLVWMRLPALVLLPWVVSAQAIQVHGYIQGRFTDEEGTPDRLEIVRARLVVTGTPVRKLSYHFQVDFAKRPYLLDGSLAWQFSRSFTVAAGQIKIPFSTESLIPDNLIVPISRSRAVQKLVPGRDTGVQGRDVGTTLSGDVPAVGRSRFEYAMGVFRGQTLIYSPDIHYNATAGRLLLHTEALTVGGDWYGSFSATRGKVKRREEIEAEYGRGTIRVRAEEIWARDGTQRRRGGYLLGDWRRPSGAWEGLIRADWLTNNAAKPDTFSIIYVAGANRYLWKFVKLGLNAGAQHDQVPDAWSSVLFAQVMLFF